MVDGELAQDAFTFLGQCEEHLTAIFRVAPPLHETLFFKPVDEFDGGVMNDLKTAGDFSDAGGNVRRHAFDGQQQLVLLRFNAGFARRTFAESNELPNVVTELRQRVE